MTSYQITSGAGEDMGVYEGETPEAAIEAMHRDAGYESSEAAAEALGTTVEALRADLAVTEATSTDDGITYYLTHAGAQYGVGVWSSHTTLAEAEDSARKAAREMVAVDVYARRGERQVPIGKVRSQPWSYRRHDEIIERRGAAGVAVEYDPIAALRALRQG